MWNTTAPILQIGKSGTAQRNEGLNVFPRHGREDAHRLGPRAIDVCPLSPFPWCVWSLSLLYRDYPSAQKREGGHVQRSGWLLEDQISSDLSKDTEPSSGVRMNAKGFCSHFPVNRYSTEEGSSVQGKIHYINMYCGEATQNED